MKRISPLKRKQVFCTGRRRGMLSGHPSRGQASKSIRFPCEKRTLGLLLKKDFLGNSFHSP